jgi:hypothetical protein
MDGAISRWELDADRRAFTTGVTASPPATRVLTVPGGCVVLAGGKAIAYTEAGATAFGEGITALARSDDGVLQAARGREIVELGGGRRTYPGAAGASALLELGDAFVIGFENGSLELVPKRTDAEAPRVTFEDVPAGAVTRLLAGPRGTMIAGYSDGFVGIWLLDTGARVDRVLLHGPVDALVLEGDRLLIGTELGDAAVVDLAPFYREYCEQLRDVWRAVPTEWEDGEAVRRPVPKGHACAR